MEGIEVMKAGASCIGAYEVQLSLLSRTCISWGRLSSVFSRNYFQRSFLVGANFTIVDQFHYGQWLVVTPLWTAFDDQSPSIPNEPRARS